MGKVLISLNEAEKDLPNIRKMVQVVLDKKNSSASAQKNNKVFHLDNVSIAYCYAEAIQGLSFTDVLTEVQKKSQTPLSAHQFNKFVEATLTGEERLAKKIKNISLYRLEIYNQNNKSIGTLKIPNNFKSIVFEEKLLEQYKSLGEIYKGDTIFTYNAGNDWLEEQAFLGSFSASKNTYFVIADENKFYVNIWRLQNNILIPEHTFSMDNIHEILNLKEIKFKGKSIVLDKTLPIEKDYIFDSEQELANLLGALSKSPGFMVMGQLPIKKQQNTTIDFNSKIRVYLDPQKNKTLISEIDSNNSSKEKKIKAKV